MRPDLKNTRRWVVKVGSSLLTSSSAGLNHNRISEYASQIAELTASGVEVVLVSSGSVAEGLFRLGMKQRPTAIHQLQAAAAVGQMGLVQAYESEFNKYQRKTAQVLLDHDDLSNRERYLNARSTLQELLKLGVVPVVNENDTVVTDEIRFGDNDTLAALVANLVDADLLVILTDQPGLYDSDPSVNNEARLISEGRAGDSTLSGFAGDSRSGLGRGGMITKLRAANLAARSGTHTLITSGKENGVLMRTYSGERLGTMLTTGDAPLAARKKWLAGRLQVKGKLVLDDGAVRVVSSQGKSLLPVGVKQSNGRFSRGDLVSCVSESGEEIARGLVNYNSEEVAVLCGKPSSEIVALLGYSEEDELIHRDNLVLCKNA